MLIANMNINYTLRAFMY